MEVVDVRAHRGQFFRVLQETECALPHLAYGPGLVAAPAFGIRWRG